MLSIRDRSAKARPDSAAAQLDFRTFIELLRYDDDLVEITREVDPYLEVGAIVRRVSEVDAKAPLFMNVKGAKNGLWRMFGNAASLRKNKKERYGRLARNLGLPSDASWKDISERTQAGKKSTPLKPNILSIGPCKENKIFGDDIDLNNLPVPTLHKEDGGKYLQTYGIHILNTPDGSWSNWSIFRGMVYDACHLVCLVGTGQHGAIIRDKWKQQGKDEIPWALALGVPPAASLAAALPVPEGVSEGEYVGALVGKPLDLVKCETNDVLVPANSEIVFEGKMLLKETGQEGPFGDYMGLIFENEGHPMPLFRVEAITYRNDPILPISVPGRITDESHTTAALAAAELLTLCKARGLPIQDACASLETHGTWCALKVDIQGLALMKTSSKDFCEEIGRVAFNDKSAFFMTRILLIGDGVDVYDFKDVIWAWVTRSRPGQDDYAFEDVPGLVLIPYMSNGRGHRRRGGKMVSDCLLPTEYEGRRGFQSVDFQHSYPEDLQARVRSNWTDMGFDQV
ncbi:Ferulic acid decarboxylase 1 [Fusarium oxysporum f. sp. conglutinans]|nr:Ferulic acid decarboxylase 1 [Fusarium oxysporum f. sp. conglutinans]